MEITDELANRFFSRFWGRQDVYSKRYVKKGTGEAGYYPQCNHFWSEKCPRKMGKKIKCRDCSNQSWKKLDIAVLKKHLEGKAADASDVIGIYPLLPDDTCRFLVFDFDNHEKDTDKKETRNADEKWREEVEALREICRQNGIDALTERSRSGRGAHVWIFFQSAVDASLARRFGFALLEKGAESVNLKSFAYYDRMLPAQDHIPDGGKSGKPGLGNLIALPLQGQALKEGNSAFIDENWNAYQDQWSELFGGHLRTQYLHRDDYGKSGYEPYHQRGRGRGVERRRPGGADGMAYRGVRPKRFGRFIQRNRSSLMLKQPKRLAA